MSYWQSLRIGVIGPGLIGGSFALALKSTGLKSKVWAWSVNSQEMALAQDCGIVDKIADNLQVLLAQTDLILIATPVRVVGEIFQQIAPFLEDRHVITDVGSTKEYVLAQAHEYLGKRVNQFVPAHPIAGSEKHGPTAARADLFVSKQVILTPMLSVEAVAIDLVKACWEACGATVLTMNAYEHDRIYAKLSHLPHLLSAAYLHAIVASERSLDWARAGTGFRDFTRIAAGPETVWRDIFLTNADAILAELHHVESVIEHIKTMIAQNRIEDIDHWLQQARQYALESR